MVQGIATKEEIEKALDLVNDEKNWIILERWFKDYYNQPEIFEWEDYQKFKEHKKSYGELPKKHLTESRFRGKRKVYRKRSNSNKISNACKLLKKCGFLDIKKFGQERARGVWNLPKYRLNMNIYFEYIKRKRKIDFPLKWKEFLEKEIENYRNPFELNILDTKQNLFDYIDHVIKKFILFKRFKIITPENINEGYLHGNSDFMISLKLALNLFDDFTKEIFRELIYLKLTNLKTDHKDEISIEKLKDIDKLLKRL